MHAEIAKAIPVETRGLVKRYGATTAVDGLDLRVEAGQVFGLLGPNGAGKTTTLRILLGLVRPTAGEAFIFGLPAGSVRARAAGLVGALIDEPAFYPYMTGRENLEILCTLSGAGHEHIDQTLRAVKLVSAAHRSVGAYSHGMRQRLGLAAALLPRPRLLILDEPASGLDPSGIRETRQLLRSLASEGTTILLSSHLLHEVQALCTHVGLMFNGRLVAAGPVAQLLSRDVQRIRLQVSDPAAACRLLAQHGFSCCQCDDGLLEAPATIADAAAINELLVTAGLRVFALIPYSPTLEDLYMEYASRANHSLHNNS